MVGNNADLLIGERPSFCGHWDYKVQRVFLSFIRNYASTPHKSPARGLERQKNTVRRFSKSPGGGFRGRETGV
jgi:hypothetical protein